MNNEYTQHCEWDNCEAEIVQEIYPFCSIEHKEKWADKHYGKVGEKKSNHTIEYMQSELRRMGQEAAVKGFKS